MEREEAPLRLHGFQAVFWLPLSLLTPGRGMAEIAPVTREQIPEAEHAAADARSIERFSFSAHCTTATLVPHVFDVRITTPFGVMASTAFLARESGTRLDLASLPLEPPGEQRVIVTADPASRSSAAPASVSRVLLRRGDQIIEPVRADGHDVTFPQSKPAATRKGGAYYFRLEPFASSLGDLEILVVPEGARIEGAGVVKLKTKKLAALR